MIIKVCGINDLSNVRDLDGMQVDLIGHIFYEQSPRCLTEFSAAKVKLERAKRVGVFVDEKQERVAELSNLYDFEYVQLHGQESVDYCRQLKKDLGVKIIKALAIREASDFDSVTTYEDVVDYFLFDTKGEAPGGNGYAFDWSLLGHYRSDRPFFLSGGIGYDHLDSIKKLDHPQLIGIDLNSKFEIAPGLKNIDSLKGFIHDISHQ